MPTDWRFVAASVAGASHVRTNACNQDRWSAASAVSASSVSASSGAMWIAMADGAGSAAYAAEGAATAVAEAIPAAVRAPATAVVAGAWPEAQEIVRRVGCALADRAAQLGAASRDLACTLLVAQLAPDALRVLQIGDGAIVYRRGGVWRRAVEPHRGAHAGETRFCTDADAADTAHTAIVPGDDIEAVAVFTDGLEPVATTTSDGEPFTPFLDPVASYVSRLQEHDTAKAAERLEAVLRRADLRSRCPDDLSLAVAARVAAAAPLRP